MYIYKPVIIYIYIDLNRISENHNLAFLKAFQAMYARDEYVEQLEVIYKSIC